MTVDFLKIQFSRVPPKVKKFSKKKMRKTHLENRREKAHAKFQPNRPVTLAARGLRKFAVWVLLNAFFCTTSRSYSFRFALQNYGEKYRLRLQ